MKKYYAISKGHVPGIYTNWPDTERQVKGFKGAIYKSFKSRKEAEAFMKNPTYEVSSQPLEQYQAKCSIRYDEHIPKNAIIVYTDGSCIKNPGPGGFGVVAEGIGKKSKGYKKTTNNRMELMAVIFALKKLQDSDKPIIIYSDSEYVIKSINKGRVFNWKTNKWKVQSGERINADLWKKFFKYQKNLDVGFRWVKGHAGYPLNELADQLAKDAAKSDKLYDDKGYLASIDK